IGLLQLIERTMHPATAPIKITTRFSRQQMIVGAGDKVSNLFGVVQRGLLLVEELLRLPVILTGAAKLIPTFLLKQRTGPLSEISAPMVFGVPRAPVNFHFFRRWKASQVFADMNGGKA